MLCTNSLKPWWMLSGTVELHVDVEQVPCSPSYFSLTHRSSEADGEVINFAGVWSCSKMLQK